MTPADVEFARKFANAQTTPMVLEFNCDIGGFRFLNVPGIFFHYSMIVCWHHSEDDAWHALAAALAPIRNSMEKVMCGELRAEIERLKDALLQTIDGRCYACGWPFRIDGMGCKPGDCCFRPNERSKEHDEWLPRQKFICELQSNRLAASPVPS